jgi:hypothetical protein
MIFSAIGEGCYLKEREKEREKKEEEGGDWGVSL